MRAFKGFNQSLADVCPICGTNEDKETVLIGIAGTEDDGIYAQCYQCGLSYDSVNFEGLETKIKNIKAQQFIDSLEKGTNE